VTGFLDPWSVLGIAQTRDKSVIRRAYSTQLKQHHPEDDPEAFKQLRSAYEWALRWSEFSHDEDGYPLNVEEPDLARVPAIPAPTPDAAVDEQAQVLGKALQDLAQELDAPAPDSGKLFALLEAATSREILERLDLAQRAEMQVGALLLQAAPRSDVLLRRANEIFDWSGRESTRKLPVYIDRLLSRLGNLDFLETLQSQASAQSRAWRRLQQPESPRRRFVRAYLQHHTWWPELELIRRLDAEHPAVLAGLPEENLLWWRRFGSRPHFSWLTFVAWFFPALALCAWLIPRGPERPAGALILSVGVTLALGTSLFRLYLVDWPVALVKRHWGDYAPRWFALGWLPAGIALMALVVAVRSLPVLAWLVAALACVTALWAIAAGGERLSVFAGTGLSPLNSRVVSIVYFNAITLLWLWLLAAPAIENYPAPLLLTFAAALCASIVARANQMRAFLSLPFIWQRRLCLLAIFIAILLTIILLARYDSPAWQAPLAMLLVSCTILRRSVHMHFPAFEFGSRFAIFYAIVGMTMVRACSASNDSLGGQWTKDALIIGGGLLLGAVIMAAVRQLSDRIELRA
jgi:hypothetical protein